MTDSLHTLFAAWGDPTPEGRASKTDAAIGPRFYYSDPNSPAPIEGRDAYLEYVAQFSAMMPGAAAKVVAVSEHHGHVRATVDFEKDGKRMVRGQYFADLEDGKVVRLIGFTGMGEPD
ncbi:MULTISPECIES: nuclear transport factor 2 family protein [unclassified Leisingera]|uniref:nuclear transport factor 2 family protein n=1 Tax=unclassified Leisingera TaxID=2614906 RepID=UPI001012F45F|nr:MULTISPECIES: nuclear transport factor 2 family protein [unclassified Leisingera]MCF6430769.1 nuclear transport factor 2 family protein [Leisingera sp. MMG026]QAX28663.1 nuclear transport factor 2 family protein [Leisingera sp. NJS204]